MGNVGIFASCVNDPADVTEDKQQKKKDYPLLCDLEADFAQHAGEDKKLDKHELTEIWKKCAKRKAGKLAQEDVALIEKSSTDFFKHVDADRNGVVTYEEFVAYMMGGTEDRGALKDMRTHLNSALRQEPRKLKDLIQRFRSWDKNGDGFISRDELDTHLKELLTMSKGKGKKASQEKEKEDIAKMKEDLFRDADVDQDGKIDMWEMMAHALGRRKIPVEIILYDISRGAAKNLGPLLLGREVEAFHSSVLVYGSEYWYGGKVFRSDPPCEKAFGKPVETSIKLKLEPSEYKPEIMVVKAGHTFVTHEEFRTFVADNLVKTYGTVAHYDLLTHSCNHFSNEVIEFLTGGNVPDHVLELQRIALTPTVRCLRPYLNNWLGGFADGMKDQSDDMDEDQDVDPEVDIKRVCSKAAGVAGQAVVISVDGVDTVATVLKTRAKTSDVKYFDPQSGALKKKNIKNTDIKREIA